MMANANRGEPEPYTHMDVGIHAVELYIPKKFVDQEALEKFDGVSAGKYTIGSHFSNQGLGQLKMAVVDDREDICSICLSGATGSNPSCPEPFGKVGRLEVGTETIIDKVYPILYDQSKSVKSVLMQLFGSNTNIEGVDTTNACYGGTNGTLGLIKALFNCLNWLESSSYDGRYAICVAADIAVYKTGSARPTGGAGAVAILLGRGAPLVFDTGVRATHVEHVYDFYKPDLHSEYPEVDGPLSNKCYTKAVDTVYSRYLSNISEKMGELATLKDLDHVLFHSPYTKLVQKSFGRLAYNDFKRDPTASAFKGMGEMINVSEEDSYTDRNLEKGFMTLTKAAFEEKVVPSLLAAKQMGNMYCASLYGGLASLLSEVGKRVGFFSYGSGLASSFFSLVVKRAPTKINETLNISSRLSDRIEISPAEYDEIMNLREKTHNMKSYVPVGDIDGLVKGSWYLKSVDEKFRREYVRL